MVTKIVEAVEKRAAVVASRRNVNMRKRSTEYKIVTRVDADLFTYAAWGAGGGKHQGLIRLFCRVQGVTECYEIEYRA